MRLACLVVLLASAFAATTTTAPSDWRYVPVRR